MNDRKHSSDCEVATNDRCRCSCNGRLHGVRRPQIEDEKQDIS